MTHPSTIDRLWAKDPTLWTSTTSQHGEIKNRLGWLDIETTVFTKLEPVRSFAMQAKNGGFRDAVVLGMGGSSLCADVLSKVLGPTSTEDCRVHILDSTDPESVREIEKKLDFRRTLFVVASKSGSTAEVSAFYQYFRSLVSDPRQFVAITDPNTSLEFLAKKERFAALFLNPPDIGGRYSALSLFGLVPAALLGVDLNRFTAAAKKMMSSCKNPDESQNPGAVLGNLMAEAAMKGQNQLVLECSKKLDSFADWMEQLVAESTGKEGKGILPVVREPGKPDKSTSTKQLFVQMSDLRDSMEIAGEFFRWEMATAVACAKLGINPFDQPDVESTKVQTRELLKDPSKLDDTGTLTTSLLKPTELDRAIRQAEFVSILAYLPSTPSHLDELQNFRVRIRNRFKRTTTLGFGPRYLHSTGQYHKGGPDKGVFFVLLSKDQELMIPGERYGFSTLKRAQAMGDIRALIQKGRKVFLIEFENELGDALRTLPI